MHNSEKHRLENTVCYSLELVHIFRELVHIFGELVHILGELVHILARKLVSRTSKQVWRNLGPLWQPGVYNDTNPSPRHPRPPEVLDVVLPQLLLGKRFMRFCLVWPA